MLLDALPGFAPGLPESKSGVLDCYTTRQYKWNLQESNLFLLLFRQARAPATPKNHKHSTSDSNTVSSAYKAVASPSKLAEYMIFYASLTRVYENLTVSRSG